MNDSSFHRPDTFGSGAGHPGIRIGTAEREQSLQALGDHLAAGRLEMDEYSERAALVAAAKTFADLEPLFADLPEPHPRQAAPFHPVAPPPPAPARDHRPERWLYTAMTVMLFLVFAALAVISRGELWFLFVLLPVARAFMIPKAQRRAVRNGVGRRW